MTIEYVTVNDAAALIDIYRPYVEDTAITFEYEVPSAAEFVSRIKHILEKYPYLKAVDDKGDILGYAYAAEFKDRRAYDWSVESTVYIRQDVHGQGIGRALYKSLEKNLQAMGILNMNACIALPKQGSTHLPADSIHFHHKLGFTDVGVFHDSGYKFGEWYDMIWMEKMLGKHTKAQADVRFGLKPNCSEHIRSEQ